MAATVAGRLSAGQGFKGVFQGQLGRLSGFLWLPFQRCVSDSRNHTDTVTSRKRKRDILLLSVKGSSGESGKAEQKRKRNKFLKENFVLFS